VKVVLRNPTRELNRESVIVIRGDTIVPGDAMLEVGDHVEIRPVISGGFA
jgi:sulfur carrier protein